MEIKYILEWEFFQQTFSNSRYGNQAYTRVGVFPTDFYPHLYTSIQSPVVGKDITYSGIRGFAANPKNSNMSKSKVLLKLDFWTRIKTYIDLFHHYY